MNCVSCVVIFLSFRTNTQNASFQHVSVQTINICYCCCCCVNWYSKCPPSARTQARRRVRHWFTAAQMMLWCKSHQSSISRSFKWLTSRILVLIGNVGDGNFRPSFYNISEMDRLVVVKFHINIANRWLFIIQRKIMLSFSIHKIILTCLGGRFFPDTV